MILYLERDLPMIHKYLQKYLLYCKRHKENHVNMTHFQKTVCFLKNMTALKNNNLQKYMFYKIDIKNKYLVKILLNLHVMHKIREWEYYSFSEIWVLWLRANYLSFHFVSFCFWLLCADEASGSSYVTHQSVLEKDKILIVFYCIFFKWEEW